MKIFHASLGINVIKKYFALFNSLVNVLVSPTIITNLHEFLVTYRHMIDELILDSAVWSVVQGKSDFSLGDYTALLKRIADKIDRCFNYDADFSTNGLEANYENQLILENAGFRPVPVVHNFHNEEIEYYCTCGKYDWLALGSKQASNFKELRYAVQKAKRANPEIKLHWFGGSKFEWLTQLPIAACDTSSWAKMSSVGMINFWNENKSGINKTDLIYIGGRIEGHKKNKYNYMTYPWKSDLERYLRETFRFEQPFHALLQRVENIQLVNLRFYVEMEQRINDERRRKGISLE